MLADIVQVRFEIDAPGPVTSLSAGENFTLQAFVQDVQASPSGVFQAYFNFNYDSSLVSVNGPITHGAEMDVDTSGDTSTAGLLKDVGGVDTDQIPPSPASQEELLFSLPMHAIQGGSFDLAPSLSTDPTKQVEMFSSKSAVPLNEINFTGPGSQATAVSVSSTSDAALTGQPVTLVLTEGAAFSGKVATFTDADPNGTASQFTATIVWGDFSPPSTGVVTTAGDGTFTVTGSHTYAEEGTNHAIVTIDDVDGASAVVTSTATVGDAPLTPQLTTVGATEGATFSGKVATFTDADPNGAVADYTATILWGDGTVSSTGTVTTAGDGTFTVTGSHAYGEEGTGLSMTVTIHDTGGAVATALSTAGVADAALATQTTTLAATEGAAFSGKVATFTDADPNGAAGDYTASILWGDSTVSSTGTVTTTGDGTFMVTGSHTYAEEASNLTVTVAISDVGGSTATAQSAAQVADAALTAHGVTLAATEGTTFSGGVATFTDANPNAAAAGYTATILWGDGTVSSTGTVTTAGDGTFTVTGSHAYAEEASNRTVTVAINDAGGATATARSSASVGDADTLAATATAIHVTEGQTFQGTVATFSDTNSAATASNFVASVDWGDGSSTSGTVSGSAGQFTVAAGHTYRDEGSFTVKQVTVTLADKAPGTAVATATSTAQVTAGLATSISPVGIEITVAEGTVVIDAQVATFTVSGGSASASDFTANIDWGDGSTSLGAVAAAGNGFSVTASHNYPSPGHRPVKITIAGAQAAAQTVDTTATVGSATERFVAQVYRDLLHREVDPLALFSWSSLIDGGLGRQQVVLDIEQSVEFRQDEVQRLYLLYLHRTAEPAAVAADSGFLAAGGTPEQLAATIASSPEYFQVRGGGTSAGFVSALYDDALGRSVDANALAATANTDFRNANNRAAIAESIFGSDEYLRDLVGFPGQGNVPPTTGLYEEYLGRSAEVGGGDFWVGKIKAGVPDAEIVAGIIGSQEYLTRSAQRPG